jgi:hypothetical protein
MRMVALHRKFNYAKAFGGNAVRCRDCSANGGEDELGA